MPPGDMERAGRIAFASLNEDALTFCPAPFICAAIFSVVGHIHYSPFAASYGHLLLQFDSRADRDVVVDLSPIIHEGGASLWSGLR